MSLEDIKKNRALSPNQQKKVLQVLDKYYSWMQFAQLSVKGSQSYWDKAKYYYDNDIFTKKDFEKVFFIAMNICGVEKRIFHGYLKDLFEFFYHEKEEAEPEGYYHFQFPLDQRRYRRDRPPREQIEVLLKDMFNLDDKAVALLDQAKAAFFQNLRQDQGVSPEKGREQV